MNDKSEEKITKQDKKKAKAEKKALKKAQKEAKKKEKLDKKKKKLNSDDQNGRTGNRKIFTIKKLIILLIIIFLLVAAVFAYKFFFSSSENPEKIYTSVSLENIKLPDEMLKFTFDHQNDLYFVILEYDRRVILLLNEINRIKNLGKQYPDQIKITEKESKNLIKAKDKAKKKFDKIIKEIRSLYVLYNVNKDQGLKKIQEKNKDLILLAREAVTSLDPFVRVIESSRGKETRGIIKKTIHKIKDLL